MLTISTKSYKYLRSMSHHKFSQNQTTQNETSTAHYAMTNISHHIKNKHVLLITSVLKKPTPICTRLNMIKFAASWIHHSMKYGLMLILCSSTIEGEGNPIIIFKKCLSIIELRSHGSFIFQNYRIMLEWQFHFSYRHILIHQCVIHNKHHTLIVSHL